jgi:hypothetical protein
VTFPPQFRPLRPAVAILTLLAWPAAALAADEPPDASFSFSPEDPRAGQPMRFESSSCVSCRGSACPAKRVSRYMGGRPVRFRRFERRLRAGAVLTVRISNDDLTGKFTQFRVRRGKEPKRRDRCLRPGETSGSRCPRD